MGNEAASTDAEDQVDSPRPAAVALRGPVQAGPDCMTRGACGCCLKGSVELAMGAVGGRLLPPGAHSRFSPKSHIWVLHDEECRGPPLPCLFVLFSPLPSLQGPERSVLKVPESVVEGLLAIQLTCHSSLRLQCPLGTGPWKFIFKDVF